VNIFLRQRANGDVPFVRTRNSCTEGGGRDARAQLPLNVVPDQKDWDERFARSAFHLGADGARNFAGSFIDELGDFAGDRNVGLLFLERANLPLVLFFRV